MKIYDTINRFFLRGRRRYNGRQVAFPLAAGGWDGSIGRLPFADAIFLNCVELLTDLTHDVTWQFKGDKSNVETAFVHFFNGYGKLVLNTLFRDGVVVIAHSQEGDGLAACHEFHIARSEEYSRQESNGWTTYRSTREGVDVYAMQSATYQMTGQSDKAICAPFLRYLDNTLNASNTVSARLGAFVVCSPKNLSNAPTAVELDEDEKAAIEKELREQYGALDKQSQMLVLPREMSWQVISLATLDLKTTDKVRLAVVAIADRIKVPANQVGMIDANSSKSLANGTEMREGDVNKYQSFERLLDQTFVQLARDCGLRPGSTDLTQGEAVGSYYTIYNKPTQSAPNNAIQ